MRDRHIPSPQEVEAAVHNQMLLDQIRYIAGVGPDGRHIQTIMTYFQPWMRIEAKPELTIVVFTLRPVIATPYFREIPGILFTTEVGVANSQASWQPEIEFTEIREGGVQRVLENSVRVFFAPATATAAEVLLRRIAKAQGKKYRSHGILTPDGGRWYYTKEP